MDVCAERVSVDDWHLRYALWDVWACRVEGLYDEWLQLFRGHGGALDTAAVCRLHNARIFQLSLLVTILSRPLCDLIYLGSQRRRGRIITFSVSSLVKHKQIKRKGLCRNLVIIVCNKLWYFAVTESACGYSDSYNSLRVCYRYTMIEDKLELSRYMPWTFVSCHMGTNT